MNGAAQTIDFLVKAFGAVEIRRFKGDGEQIMHVEVRIEDSFLMLADGDEDWPTAPSNVHIYAPDVDATYKLAL